MTINIRNSAKMISGIEIIKKTLKSYPLIWFDNTTMSFLIERPRRSIARYRVCLRKEGILEERKSYFRLKLEHGQ